jgi:nucleotide-binding universal stress UspA family protein
MISRVIVPLDFSDVSEAALPLAAHLAQRRGVPMTLVHVIEMSPEFLAYSEGVSQVDALLELEEKGQEYLRRIADGISGVEVETVVLRGRPARQIVELVDEYTDPLIVMSSHGHSGFRRMVLGSVAARVVQTAGVPVMLVRATEEGSNIRVPSEVRRVVVPLDGSDFAEYALDATFNIVGGDDVEIRLVRVPEIAAYPATMYGAASYEAVDMYMEAMRTEAQTYLEEMAARLRERHPNVSWEVREGAASAVILEVAREFDADLIAMASHGRTGFRRFLMGSVAEQVLRDAEVPVLVVGPKDDD